MNITKQFFLDLQFVYVSINSSFTVLKKNIFRGFLMFNLRDIAVSDVFLPENIDL